MTRTARRLGMRGTRFANASGLPAAGQYTTARDMAILSLALLRDHPGHYRHFATRAFTWRGQRHLNHNHLLTSFQGMDGIKTGFINASGFNLAASAVRGGRRYVAVVLGGDSARARDRRVAGLLEDAFAGRLDGDGDLLLAASDDVPDVEEVAQPRPRRKVVTASVGTWRVQVGAFATRGAALNAARAAAAALPGVQRVEVARPRGSRLYRGRLATFTAAEARAACARLDRRGIGCTPVARR
jgi:D-alanyl-D-alanine carboxypeptidase